jgi:hypothetical protein
MIQAEDFAENRIDSIVFLMFRLHIKWIKNNFKLFFNICFLPWFDFSRQCPPPALPGKS